jgi:hypothetical protein
MDEANGGRCYRGSEMPVGCCAAGQAWQPNCKRGCYGLTDCLCAGRCCCCCWVVALCGAGLAVGLLLKVRRVKRPWLMALLWVCC